jgi:site-specific DNA-methyltransferase (adenine-specific)
MLIPESLSQLAESCGFDLKVGAEPCEEAYSVCIAAPSFDPADRHRPFNFRRDPAAALIERNAASLVKAARRLDAGGLMFVYGLPAHLARYATALSSELAFRYWIGIRSTAANRAGAMRPEHMGLLLMSRPAAPLNRLRIPHATCRHCGNMLKDWGGKSHLRHGDGVALSDVWMDFVVDANDPLPSEVFERILRLCEGGSRKSLRMMIDGRSLHRGGLDCVEPAIQTFDPLRWQGLGAGRARRVPDEMLNRLHRGSCLEILQNVPSETIDLAFADPPFNLTKAYNGYRDNRNDYTGWCKRWLVEYERVLKPGGAIFLVNLPKWSVRLADYLTRTSSLYLQRWIVWNSLPEPKGVLMPAHYSVLYLTKGESASRFNYCSMEEGWQPFDEAVFPPDRFDVCRRRSCVRRRRASGTTWRGELTDIWYDIHRERQYARKIARLKAHPCRTPESLLDRIIRLATDPGDIVLDAFAGVGTAAMVAGRLGRNFVAIEQDGVYTEIAERRISEQESFVIPARSAPRPRGVSKRRLQLELRSLALSIGRLPARADVEKMSQYDLELFDRAFDSWTVALKAARMVVPDAHSQSLSENLDVAGWINALDGAS